MSKRFGIREVCHCTFTPAKESDPYFVIDTAKMSTLEGASTTVYAQGGSGNSRLVAWEGEKTMTFTIEDALITKESFRALTGATLAEGNIFKIYPYSFAGNYKITAYTLFRDEDGIDHVATIVIPKAKLQTQLNLSMSPTGDPSTFTFTFDAFPDKNGDDKNLIFSLELDEGDNFSGSLDDYTGDMEDTVYIYINRKLIGSYDLDQTLTLETNGDIKVGTETIDQLEEDEILSNLESSYVYGSTGAYKLKAGENHFYII